jgi:hypothetical protein
VAESLSLVGTLAANESDSATASRRASTAMTCVGGNAIGGPPLPTVGLLQAVNSASDANASAENGMNWFMWDAKKAASGR